MRRHFLLPLLVLSGFAGLAYELMWVRLLAASFGSTTLSFATVLAVFFGGLAVGSRWAGSKLATCQRPIATYALLELLTGAAGLVLLVVLKHLSTLFAILDPGPGPVGLLVRFAVSAVLLVPPTFLMGATLPYVCLASIARDEATGRGTALVYGFNTLGACLGAYGVTFWLLPFLGVTRSNLVVVGLNVLVAGVAFLVARKTGDGPAAPVETQPAVAPEKTDGLTVRLVLLAAFVGGLSATGAQVVWARFFAIALRGTSYGLGAVLVSVLVGIALGSLLAAQLARGPERIARWAAIAQATFIGGLALFAASLPAFFYLLGTLPNGELTGRWLLHLQVLVVWLTLAVATVASGAALPLLVGVIEHSARGAGHSLARVYAANTLGCILGSLIVGYFMLPTVGSSSTLYAVILLSTVSLLAFAAGALRHARKAAIATVGIALLVAATFPGVDGTLTSSANVTADYFTWRKSVKRRADQVVSTHEGDIATVVVAGTEATALGVSLNGLGQGTRNAHPPQTPWESSLVAAMPWVHAATPKVGLVVGLGAGGTVRDLLDLGVQSVEVLELERGVVDAVKSIWKEDSPLLDPHVTLVLNDARQHLLVKSRRAPASYDFITSMPAHPWVASALFTREFFEVVAANLAPGGVFSTWFGIGGLTKESLEALFGAFTRVFPHSLAYWVPESRAFYLVGGNSELVIDFERLENLAQRGSFAARSPAQRSPYYLLSRVVASSGGQPSADGSTLVNTDDNSIIEFGVPTKPISRPQEQVTWLPVRGLPLSRLKAKDPSAVALELIERWLETPLGRLPLPPAMDTARSSEVRRQVEVLGPPQPLKDYATIRLLIAERKLSEARTLLAEAPASPLTDRARVFLAAAEPEPARRRAELQALPSPRADVLALRWAEGDDSVKSIATSGGDALGWLFGGPLEPEPDGTPGERALLERLRSMRSPTLYARCAERAAAEKFDEIALTCRALETQARQAEAGRLFSLGMEAGARGDYRSAVDLLWRSHAVEPLPSETVQLLLRTALRVSDEASIAKAKGILRLRGYAEPTIASLAASFVRLNAEEASKP